MKLTDATRERLRIRRGVRDLTAAGYEEVGERGGMLWELYRGARTDHQIVDVRIGPTAKSLFIKTAKHG